MSRIFPWKVTFLRRHFQLATGECTFKRAVIRRRRRGFAEGLSRLSCGVWDFKWEPACIVSIQLHCQLRAITLFLWVCQKLWRRKDLLPEYLTVSTISLLPFFGLKDVLPWHNHKIWGKKWKILIKRQKKIPAHNRNWKIFQKEFGIICLYNDFIEYEWFVEVGKVEVLSKYNQLQIISKHWLQLKNATFVFNKDTEIETLRIWLFSFLVFSVEKKIDERKGTRTCCDQE